MTIFLDRQVGNESKNRTLETDTLTTRNRNVHAHRRDPKLFHEFSIVFKRKCFIFIVNKIRICTFRPNVAEEANACENVAGDERATCARKYARGEAQSRGEA